MSSIGWVVINPCSYKLCRLACPQTTEIKTAFIFDLRGGEMAHIVINHLAM